MDSRKFEMQVKRRRQITYQAGRALEILGHSVDYLIDMHEHEGSLLVWEAGYLEAIEILKARNREIYLGCPVMPSLEERILSLISRKRLRG